MKICGTVRSPVVCVSLIRASSSQEMSISCTEHSFFPADASPACSTDRSGWYRSSRSSRPKDAHRAQKVRDCAPSTTTHAPAIPARPRADQEGDGVADFLGRAEPAEGDLALSRKRRWPPGPLSGGAPRPSRMEDASGASDRTRTPWGPARAPARGPARSGPPWPCCS